MSLASITAQWRANRRLRVFVLLAAVALLANVAMAVSAWAGRQQDEYASGHRLLLRLQQAAADAAWPERAEEAEAARATLEESLVAVAGPGQAQAELQASLAAAAATAGLADAAVRTEAAAAVDGLPGVLEVSARVAGAANGPTGTALLSELARQRWIRIDRVEIRDDAPGQVQLVVRGYFRLADAEPGP